MANKMESQKMHPTVRAFAWLMAGLLLVSLAMAAGMTVLGVL